MDDKRCMLSCDRHGNTHGSCTEKPADKGMSQYDDCPSHRPYHIQQFALANALLLERANIEFSCSAEPPNPGVGPADEFPAQMTKVPLTAATIC
jgi:hypothetical protein